MFHGSRSETKSSKERKKRVIRWIPFQDPELHKYLGGYHFRTQNSQNVQVDTISGPQTPKMFRWIQFQDPELQKCLGGCHSRTQNFKHV